jgi:hypothetical protein
MPGKSLFILLVAICIVLVADTDAEKMRKLGFASVCVETRKIMVPEFHFKNEFDRNPDMTFVPSYPCVKKLWIRGKDVVNDKDVEDYLRSIGVINVGIGRRQA